MRTATVSLLYAFRLLRAHGLSGQRLYDIVVATAIARLTYATPAWVGYITADQKARIRASIRKLQRQDFLPSDQADFDDLCKKADIRLFHSILSNKHHVLHKFLTPVKDLKYQLRPRLHNLTLPYADTFERFGFILRMLFTFYFLFLYLSSAVRLQAVNNKVCTYLLTYLIIARKLKIIIEKLDANKS